MRAVFTFAIVVSTLGLGLAAIMAFGAAMQLGAPGPADETAALLHLVGLIGVVATPVVGALGIAGAMSVRRSQGPGVALLPLLPAPLFAAGAVALVLMGDAARPDIAPLPQAPTDLAELPRFLAANPDLATLDLRRRGLAEVPPQVLAAPVETIDLRDNPITALPDALLDNGALRRLLLTGTAVPLEEQRRFALLIEQRGVPIRLYF
jgi:hypothetical protein